ncbi:NACHT domain-containing protein [Actinomadura parmotrematis]|uniref:NACHT domain-containing protein n=1 Tax=Actinomadura parmotrematis TaxID=2864039 RepID=A0ABS7FK39_9ACTN|nr:NACHT domain-containing protein [Actinomadura parmotrematis]MBW8480742.1 NACHT domain-containing protein [Actinomadura parmotrematis]
MTETDDTVRTDPAASGGPEGTPPRRARRLLWVVALLLPPLLAVALWPIVAANIAIAVVLLLCYAVVAAFMAAPGRRERRRDRAERKLTRSSGRFGEAYARSLAAELRGDARQAAPAAFAAPLLEDVAVDVTPRDGGPGERVPLSSLIGGAEPCVLALVGEPGGGRTALLRRTALRLALSPDGARRPVPVLLCLRDHAARIVAEPGTGLAELAAASAGKVPADRAPDWFAERLAAGACTVLLDGLDEVADLADRRAVAAWIARQARELPGNDVVVAARAAAYRAAPVEGARVVETRGLTGEQVTAFLRGWYRAVEPAGRGAAPVEDAPDRAAGELRERLRAAPALDGAIAAPLSLTMIANLDRRGAVPPADRLALLAAVCDVPGAPDAAGPLRELAYAMMRDRVRDVPRDGLDPVLRGGAGGLLAERPGDRAAFAQPAFQEYLAAERIAADGPVDALTGSVTDDWWRECALMYAARSDAGPLVRACLDAAHGAGGAVALELALACADEGDELDPALRAELNALLAPGSDLDPARRAEAGAAATARRLRQTFPVASGGRLCVQPVSEAMYAQFLDARPGHDPDRAPGDRDPDAAVTGVRAEDAVAFVDWVNGLTGGRHRLPYRAEVEDRRVRDLLPPGGHCLWVRPDAAAEAPVLWRPPDAPDPHALSPGLVARSLDADLPRIRASLAAMSLLWARTVAVFAQRLAEESGDPEAARALARLPAVAAGLGEVRGSGLLDGTVPELRLDLAYDLEEQRVRDALPSLAGNLKPGQAAALARVLGAELVAGLSSLLDAPDGPPAGLPDLGPALRDLAAGLRRDRRRHPAAYAGTGETAPVRLARATVDDVAVGERLRRAFRTVPHRAETLIDGVTAAWPTAAQLTGLPHLLGISWTPLLLPDRAGQPERPYAARWSQTVNEEVVRLAGEVFDRSTPFDARAARTLRLVALAVPGASVADKVYIDIAAAAVWVERRRTGRTQPVESIVLATG